MKQIPRYLTLVLLLAVSACNRNTEKANFETADVAMAPAPQGQSVQITERKLIKEGRVEFETDNLSATRQTIFKAVEKYKGYISSDQEFNYPGRETNTVVLRVPAASFDAFLSEATAGVERFESKTIDVKDVTEEFLDVEARLKTKKALETRYTELVKRAKDVSEILEIEKEMGQLRAEIESIEGRLKYLQNQVAFSTLTMTFYERIPNQTQFGERFKDSLRNGWDNLIWFFVLSANVWPFIVIGLGVLIGIRTYKRKK